MKYCLILLQLLVATIVTGQIFTPPITSYTGCPTSWSQIYRCKGWRSPTGASPDYYNACAGVVGVPNNFAGYQTAPENAYFGIFSYLNGYMEYIATNIKPLTPGQTYTMTISVSLADSSTRATDGLGVLFTTTPYSTPLFNTLSATPQIDYSGYGIIKDKNNWVTLSKTFVADSAYNNIIIGCFKTSATINMDTVSGGNTLNDGLYTDFSYYYIGQIGISDTSLLPQDTTANPNTDTTKPPVTIADTTEYFFPNAFSPNEDGNNDVFRIKGLSRNIYFGYSLRVFNRWGQCIFHTTDPNSGWDGTFNNQKQDIGVYFYLAQFGLNNKLITAKGDLTLIR
jgi:gliding motility-associated-like protein